MEKELSCNSRDHVNLKQDLSDNFGIVHLNLESYNNPLRCVYLFEETDEVVISQLEFKSAGRHISNFDWDLENKFFSSMLVVLESTSIFRHKIQHRKKDVHFITMYADLNNFILSENIQQVLTLNVEIKNPLFQFNGVILSLE